MALEDGRLDVVAVASSPGAVARLPPVSTLAPSSLADVDVGEDLLELVVGGLRADHRRRVERVALHDLLHALDGTLHEGVVDALLHERARRAGANLALVEGEHGEALERLVEELVVLVEHVGEEDVRRLAAQLQRDGDDILGRRTA